MDLFLLGSAVCHQIAERSFSFGGAQFPLCARCSGLYVGFAVAFLVFFLRGRWRKGQWPSFRWRMLLLPVLVFVCFEGMGDLVGFWKSPMGVRFAWGLATGTSLAVFLAPLLNSVLWTPTEQSGILQGGSDLLLLVLVVMLGSIPFFVQSAILFWPALLLSYAGVLLLLVQVNLLLLAVALKWEGGGGFRDLMGLLLLSLVLTGGEVTALGLLRRLSHFS